MPINAVIKLMERYQIPRARKNYLELAYWGEPPRPWTSTEEDELPAGDPRLREGDLMGHLLVAVVLVPSAGTWRLTTSGTAKTS